MPKKDFNPVFALLPSIDHTDVLRSAIQIVNEGHADAILIHHQKIEREDMVAELQRLAGMERSTTDRNITGQHVTIQQYRDLAQLLMNTDPTRSVNLDDILDILMPHPPIPIQDSAP